ncbi:tail fiber assembly protein, partial [Escherichia sp. E1S7]
VSMPGNATDIAPGDEVVGEVAVFSDNNWKWLTDHRNEIVYSTMDGTFSAVDYIGEVKEGFTTSAPATPHDVWDGEKWVTDSEAQHVAEVAAAETEKQTHIYQTNTYINSKQWPGKAAMGRLKDTEKEQYNLWLDYLDALEAVDILNAPDINWPVTPEV